MVTVVFSDLKGSTSLGERLDSESLREILNHYFSEMKAVLERHGGTVEKYIGDAIMAVFGLPILHEDDAVRAVRAAAEMKAALAEVNEQLQRSHGVILENRTGVNTGEVVAGDVTAGQRLVTGDTVNVAARLEQNAPAMEVLVGESTYRLVRNAVDAVPVDPLRLKGKSEPTPAYLLLSVTRDDGVARRLDAPIVGREHELATLADALAMARRTRSCQALAVVAPAGVGKSRLLQEFVLRSGASVSVLRGRCLSYGDGITFWPLADMTRQAAGITDDDSLETARAKLDALLREDATDVADRIGAAIGLSTELFPVNETFWAARRFFEILAARNPLVVIVEDIHWAEPTFLDLIRYVVESTEDSAVVIACSSRPDLLEDHPELAEARSHLQILTLEPLSEDESVRVVENLLGSTALDGRARARIIEAAEGNPLFVEQMLSMLIDDGILDRDAKGRWILVRDLGSFTIPPTINALLSARLDRLGMIDRAVIGRGAVMGQVFFSGAVQELAPENVRPGVAESLANLTRKELIRPQESTFAGQEAFRFGHILIRDAAYHSLLKRSRAELHERFVDWLERVAPDRVIEYEEIRGYHLEQAYLIRVQLGPFDDHTRAIGARGSQYLASAGRRAQNRGDMPAAATLLQRAGALLPPESLEKPRLLMEAGEALVEIGEFRYADSVLGAAIETAAELRDRPLTTTAQLVRLQLHYSTEGGNERQIVEEVERAVHLLEEAANHEGLFRAWRLLTLVHWTECQYAAAEDATRRMIEEAALAGDRLLERRYLGSLAITASWGPTPTAEALEECEELLQRAGGDRKARAFILTAQARLDAMQGNIDRARDHLRQARTTFEELGWRLEAALISIVSGPVEMMAGDPAAAEAELRTDYETLERLGERNYISTIAGFLGEALYQQGRYEDAESFAGICQEVAARGDVLSQFLWRCVLGKVLARRRRFDEAEALVKEAVEIIRTSDDPDSQGNSLMSLAEVLLLADQAEEAFARVSEAERLFESKGNVVSGQRARGLAEAFAGGTSPVASIRPPGP
jgi:predicted ATPase/class 3 adenylate cyclase